MNFKKFITVWLPCVLIASVVVFFGLLKLFGGINETMNDDKGSESTEMVESLEAVATSPIEPEKEWTEDMIQETIHGMTHQKVIADMKWGAIQMTEQNIDSIDKVVEAKKGDLEHYHTYRSILDRWQKEDFSRVDDDHNYIWKLQNGTMGKAHGVADKETEKAFIQNTFE